MQSDQSEILISCDIFYWMTNQRHSFLVTRSTEWPIRGIDFLWHVLLNDQSEAFISCDMLMTNQRHSFLVTCSTEWPIRGIHFLSHILLLNDQSEAFIFLVTCSSKWPIRGIHFVWQTFPINDLMRYKLRHAKLDA